MNGVLDKIVKIKLLRPIVLVLMSIFLVGWIMVYYLFGIEE